MLKRNTSTYFEESNVQFTLYLDDEINEYLIEQKTYHEVFPIFGGSKRIDSTTITIHLNESDVYEAINKFNIITSAYQLFFSKLP